MEGNPEEDLMPRQNDLDLGAYIAQRIEEVRPGQRLKWTNAASALTGGNPDEVIALLLHDLLDHEEAAEPTDEAGRVIRPCDENGWDARNLHIEKADKVFRLLWPLADDYGAQRVWGPETIRRQAQRAVRAPGLLVSLQALSAVFSSTPVY